MRQLKEIEEIKKRNYGSSFKKKLRKLGRSITIPPQYNNFRDF